MSALLQDENLAAVHGGGAKKKIAKKLAKVALKKVPVVGWAMTGYDAGKGYSKARKQGKSKGRAAWEGVKAAVW